MHRNGPDLFIDLSQNNAATLPTSSTTFEPSATTTLEWDWDIEHADRILEAKADAEWQSELPFQVDRKVLKDVVRERMGLEVGRINFLSLGKSIEAFLYCVWSAENIISFNPHVGTFHKARLSFNWGTPHARC